MERKQWSNDEETYVINNFNIKTTSQIAKTLGRSSNSVASKIGRLGLIKITDELTRINLYIEQIYPYLKFIVYNGSRANSTILNTDCGHIWEVRPDYVKNRGIGIKCPTCNKTNRKKNTKSFLNCLQSKGYTQIVSTSEYITSKDIIIINYCCGHSSEVLPTDILNKGTKSICRECHPQSYNSKSHSIFAREVLDISPDLVLLDQYVNDKTYLRVKSSTCSHTWKINPHNFLQKHTLVECPECSPKYSGSSTGETELLTWITKVYDGKIIHSNRTILDGYELDIVLPDIKLAIEYNGEYWHSSNHKDNYYHINKTLAAANKGYRLIHIFEHEWRLKSDIVKSRLSSMLGRNYSLGSRKCIIKQIPFPKEFLIANHIQGAGTPTKLNFGLYFHEELVAVMTFGRPRFTNEYEYELVRYCSLLDINVIGGASRLLKYFINNYTPTSIISYSDKRWSDGSLYKKLNFAHKHTSDPSYFYFRNFDIISRYRAQKHKLKTLFPDIYKDELSESKIMELAKYVRIYDCGTDVWVL
jgi:very-short-patch-repair endonuclease